MIDQVALAERGYTTQPLLEGAHLARLADELLSLGVDTTSGFVATSNAVDRTVAVRADRAIRAVVTSAVERALPRHRVFLTSFLVKGSAGGARIEFHQDLSYTDELRDRAIVVWIPLCDVDADHGALAVVPGSHRWTTGSRPSGQRELPTAPHQREFGRMAVSLDVPAGTAVAYDAALVHGSPETPAGAARVAIGLAAVPGEAELVHLHADPSGASITAYRVDERYHAEQGLLNRPVGYAEVDTWGEPVAAADFVEHLGAR